MKDKSRYFTLNRGVPRAHVVYLSPIGEKSTRHWLPKRFLVEFYDYLPAARAVRVLSSALFFAFVYVKFFNRDLIISGIDLGDRINVARETWLILAPRVDNLCSCQYLTSILSDRSKYMSFFYWMRYRVCEREVTNEGEGRREKNLTVVYRFLLWERQFSFYSFLSALIHVIFVYCVFSIF